MTQHPEQNSIPKLPLEISKEKISDGELASFLKRLAELYKSPTTGNLPLSEALSELSNWVIKRSTASKVPTKSSKRQSLDKPAVDVAQLRALDIKAVEDFVADERKTKIELIDLASARFSIPRSQLNRLKISDVRETIKAAYLHEDSIEIISQEARREGSNRSS